MSVPSSSASWTSTLDGRVQAAKVAASQPGADEKQLVAAECPRSAFANWLKTTDDDKGVEFEATQRDAIDPLSNAWLTMDASDAHETVGNMWLTMDASDAHETVANELALQLNSFLGRYTRSLVLRNAVKRPLGSAYVECDFSIFPRAHCGKADMPTCVVEVGVAQSMPSLLRRAGHWAEAGVPVVLVVKVYEAQGDGAVCMEAWMRTPDVTNPEAISFGPGSSCTRPGTCNLHIPLSHLYGGQVPRVVRLAAAVRHAWSFFADVACGRRHSAWARLAAGPASLPVDLWYLQLQFSKMRARGLWSLGHDWAMHDWGHPGPRYGHVLGRPFWSSRFLQQQQVLQAM